MKQREAILPIKDSDDENDGSEEILDLEDQDWSHLWVIDLRLFLSNIFNI